MRRLGWYAVSAVVAAIILGGVLLLAANLYVQSQTVQQRIRQALTATLRMPVTIRKTTISPWEGLRIDGLTARAEGGPASMKAASEAAEADFLKADSFRVRFALWPLLHRQFVVNLLWLDKPELAWAQEPDGRWQFPPGGDAGRHRKKSAAPAPTATPAPESSVAASPAPTGVAVVTPPPSAAPTAPAPERVPRRPEGFSVALDKVRLRHGTLDFFNAKRRAVGRFEDVNLDGHLADAQHAAGTVWCDKASMTHPELFLTKFHSKFAYDHDDGLTLSDGQAAFAGGAVVANCHVGTSDPGAPFSGECRVEQVDLKQLLQQLAAHVQLLEGGLQGKVVVKGVSGSADSRTATGRFELVNARLKDFPLFQTLGELLRIDDLSHMQFKVAQLDCRLDGTVLAVEPLLLVSNDLKITAQGRYLTDGDQLDLHGRLMIDEAVSRQLPDFIGDQFKPCGTEAPGSRFVDFDVTGPLNNPKSNLYNRLVGDPMRGFLHDIFSSKPKTPKEKSPKHRPESPTPTPTASPSVGQ